MFTLLTKLWQNTKAMPFLLRLLTRGGMVAGPILLVFLIVPTAGISVNGRHVTYGELWSSGVGPAMALFVVLVIIGTWGLAARQKNARWALVLAPAAPPVVHAAFSAAASRVASDWMSVDRADCCYGCGDLRHPVSRQSCAYVS